MRRSLIALMAILWVTNPAQAINLDHTAYDVKVKPDATAKNRGAKAYDEILIFRDGKLRGAAALRDGFNPGEYETQTPDKGTIAWHADMKSDTVGTASWQGAVSGRSISGTMIQMGKEGQPLTFTFRGKFKSIPH